MSRVLLGQARGYDCTVTQRTFVDVLAVMFRGTDWNWEMLHQDTRLKKAGITPAFRATSL